MKSYCVAFDSRGNALLIDRVLYGKSPLDAVKNAYPDFAVKRVKWEDAQQADLIIEECTVRPNGDMLRLWGGRRYCYYVTRNERG